MSSARAGGSVAMVEIKFVRADLPQTHVKPIQEALTTLHKRCVVANKAGWGWSAPRGFCRRSARGSPASGREASFGIPFRICVNVGAKHIGETYSKPWRPRTIWRPWPLRDDAPVDLLRVPTALS